MPEYRRTFTPGGTFFFTVVSYNRLPVLTSVPAREILRAAWQDVQTRFPFTIEAVCLLPEHIHCIWTLPDGDGNTSLRWKEIKRLFTRQYLNEIAQVSERSTSRAKRGEAAVWQRRFWEHDIRDEIDFNRHMDYLHYNPVKHGLVSSPQDWPWSSFHRYVRLGYYPAYWGAVSAPEVGSAPFGE